MTSLANHRFFPPRTKGALWVAAMVLVLEIAFPSQLHCASYSDPEYLIDVWETEQGLPEDSATAMVQTPDGYLWFGTFDGLVRFDGVKFTVFNRSNTPELPDPGVVNLYLDRNGSLWISTMKGMACVKDGKWKTYQKGSGWLGDYARFFAESPSGELYVTTFNNKILQFRGDKFEEISPPTEADPKLGFVPYIDHAGALWVFNPQFIGKRLHARWQETIPARALILQDPSPRSHQLMAGASRDGGLWIVTTQHLRKYRDGQLVFEVRAPWVMEGFWNIYEDSKGNVWIPSWNHGVYRFSPQKGWRSFTTSTGLSYDGIRFVFQDKEANLWVGTSGGGLMRFKRRNLVNWGIEQGLQDRNVKTLSVDPSERIFIGTNSQGVAVLDGKRIHRLVSESQNIGALVLSVLADHQGRVWVGTDSDGLFLVSNKNGTNKDSVVARKIAPGSFGALFEDSRGRIWADGDSGELAYENGQLKKYPVQDAAPEIGTMCMAESPADGVLWACADSGGLYRLEKDKFVPVREAQEVSRDTLTALLADKDGTIWIATLEGALFCFRQGRLTKISEKQGLPAHTIGSILDDGLGNLWIGWSHGILRIPRVELEAVLTGRKQEMTTQVFNRSDGMESVECSVYQPSAVRDRDGRLWFATFRGLVRVEPKTIRINTQPPPVTIDEVLVDGRATTGRESSVNLVRPAGNRVDISAGTHRLEIHFAALSFTAPEKIHFRYMLGGLDRDWIDIGDRRVVYLQDLKPGKYQFRVIAANDSGIWNNVGATYAILVRPHFYQTYWFYSLCVFGVVLSGFGVGELRTRRLRMRASELRSLVKERTEALQAEVSERKRAEEQVSLLQTITMEAATAKDLSSALEVVLRRVCEKTGWVLGQAWIPRADGAMLECSPAWYHSLDGLEKFRSISEGIRFKSGVGLPGRVWISKQALWVPDVTLDGNFPRSRFAEQFGLKAGLGVPILVRKEVIAVLEFFLREPHAEDERLVEVITAVADQLGLVIQRKRSEQERERLINQLQDAMAQVKILSGFLPICASCKKIRDKEGRWEQMETYIRNHSQAEFSHGLCPDCAQDFYPEYYRTK